MPGCLSIPNSCTSLHGASPVLSSLLESARLYMRQGLASSTITSYDFAWKTFAFFCMSVSLPLLPVHISTVCAFICFCKDVKNWSLPYIRSLLAGVQFNVRCYDPSFPSLFSHHSIKLILKGIAKASTPVSDNRRPITLSILHSLISALRSGMFTPYIDSLLESTFLLAFYGFLRSGEFTTPSFSFNPEKDLSLGDLVFHPDYYLLSLKHSKSKGACSVIIARTKTPFCPYIAMLKYLSLRSSSFQAGPLFLTPDYKPLSKAWFINHLKLVLLKCRIPPSQYSGHSFRIGAATSAASQGISTASLQQLGRWSS